MKAYIFSFFLFIVIAASAQETSLSGVKEIMVISDHYRGISSLQMNIKYKAYADTLQKQLLDSSIEKFVSYNHNTFTSHQNTVSIVVDSLVFFIDHIKKVAYLDRRPIINSGSEDVQKKMQSFFNQGKGYRRTDLGNGKVKYRISSDSLIYDWIEVFIDTRTKNLNRITYKFSEKGKKNGVSQLVIDFTDQQFGKKVDSMIFSLDQYLSFKESTQINLRSRYSDYKFQSYVY